MRCAEVLETAPKTTVCLWQHAEDLGRAAMGSQLAFGSLNPSARWQSDDRWRPLPSADAPTGRTTPNQLGSLAMRTGSYSWVSMDGPPFNCNRDMFYLGLLPRSCGHEHPPLIEAETGAASAHCCLPQTDERDDRHPLVQPLVQIPALEA